MPNDAYIAVTQVNQWEEMLKELVISTIQGIATTFTPDDFIAWPQGLHSRPLTYDHPGNDEQRWAPVNDHLLVIIGDHAANWGAIVNWVRIRDVSLAPHGATIVETDAVFDMPTTIIEHSVPSAKPPAPKPSAAKAPDSQPKGQQGSTNRGNVRQAEETTQADKTSQAEETTQAVPISPDPADQEQSSSPPQLPNEKVLVEAYKAVQDGKITDPATIRSIGAKFEQVAHDPDARNTVSFDAERAAQILYGWAQKNETLYIGEYEDETKPDWAVRRPNDENLMAGG